MWPGNHGTGCMTSIYAHKAVLQVARDTYLQINDKFFVFSPNLKNLMIQVPPSLLTIVQRTELLHHLLITNKWSLQMMNTCGIDLGCIAPNPRHHCQSFPMRNSLTPGDFSVKNFGTLCCTRCVVVLLSYNPYFLVQLSSEKRYIYSAEKEVKFKRVGWLIVPRESLRFMPYGLSRHMAGTIFGTHSGLAGFANPPQ